MLLNVAVGGNFGGAVGPDTTFPQQTLVDYVRLYQARPKPVPFAASFRDDFRGWKQVSIPFTAFKGHKGTTLDLTAVALDQLRCAGPHARSGAARPGSPEVR